MEFRVNCSCGQCILVTPSQAGAEIQCKCGDTIRLPSLSELKRGVGIPISSQIATNPQAPSPEWALVCEACGVEAPTRNVALHSNIGLVIVRIPSSIQGRLCKSCLHRYFWRFTGTTAIFGWWGFKSLFVTPFILLNNVLQYGMQLRMEPVPAGAVPPNLTYDAAERIKGHSGKIFDRLNNGEDLMQIAKSVAADSGVTPAQVILFVRSKV